MKLNTQDLTVIRTATGYRIAGNLGVTPEDGDGFPAFRLLDGHVRVALPTAVGEVEADVQVVLVKGGS